MNRTAIYLVVSAILFLMLFMHCRIYSDPIPVYDEDTTASVRKAMEQDPVASPYLNDVFITTYNGVVTLSGVVDNEAARTRLENIAKSLVGYNKVVDNINVRYGHNLYR